MGLEEYRLSADDIACAKKLAELFEKGEYYVMMTGKDVNGQFVDSLDLPAEKRAAILGTMEHIGLISDPQHAAGFRYLSYKIGGKVVQVARAIHEQETKKEEPRDIVEQVKATVRGNRILAWALIGFFILVGLSSVVSLVNGLFDLLKKLGVLR